MTQEHDYRSWTRDKLKEELQKRGLSSAGKKEELLQRLLDNDNSNHNAENEFKDLGDLAPPKNQPQWDEENDAEDGTGSNIVSEDHNKVQDKAASAPVAQTSPSEKEVQKKEEPTKNILAEANEMLEVLRKRAAKFGVDVSDKERAIQRAIKFGGPLPSLHSLSNPQPLKVKQADALHQVRKKKITKGK